MSPPMGAARAGIAGAKVSAIPDSDLLHSRWDPRELSASDGDRLTSLPDLHGNNDFADGTGVDYVADGPNSNPWLSLGGSSDVIGTSGLDTTISQPFTVGIVGILDSTGRSSSESIWGGRPSSGDLNLWFDAGGSYQLFAGSALSGGTPDTSVTISIAVVDGSSSQHDVDNTTVASGNVGSRDLEAGTPFMLGDRYLSGGSEPFGGNIGETLLYDGIPSVSDLYSYLVDGWGPV